MQSSNVSKIFEILSQKFVNPKTELDYTNHYTLLVAVILSAQSTDVGVNKATKSLFSVVATPEDMLKLGEDGLKSYIKTIGLFNSKAKNILSMSGALVEKYNSQVPEDFEALKSLAGVGRKTANVVLNVGFNHPTIAVDTHVFRVANRLGLVKTKTPDETELALLKIIPKQYLQNAHHQLILHGRYTCKARKPLCEECELKGLCGYYKENKKVI